MVRRGPRAPPPRPREAYILVRCKVTLNFAIKQWMFYRRIVNMLSKQKSAFTLVYYVLHKESSSKVVLEQLCKFIIKNELYLNQIY